MLGSYIFPATSCQSFSGNAVYNDTDAKEFGNVILHDDPATPLASLGIDLRTLALESGRFLECQTNSDPAAVSPLPGAGQPRPRPLTSQTAHEPLRPGHRRRPLPPSSTLFRKTPQFRCSAFPALGGCVRREAFSASRARRGKASRRFKSEFLIHMDGLSGEPSATSAAGDQQWSEWLFGVGASKVMLTLD